MNRTPTTIFCVLAGVFCVRIVLAMTGVTEAINAELPYIPAPTYLEPALLHTLYGMLLFALVMTTGLATLKIRRHYSTLSVDDLSILGFMAGLIACLGLALLSLLGTGGQVVAAVLIIAALASCREQILKHQATGIYPGALIILLAIAFGAHFAFMWRPATGQYPGAIDLGDLTIYIGWYHTLEKSLYPFYNLGVEGDFISSYFNNLHNIYALALNFLPQFDIYLFTTASLGTFYLLSISWMLRALLAYRSRQSYTELSTIEVLTICALFVAAARYPSWIGESPPVVFMVPIVLAVMYSVSRAGDAPARLAFAFVLAVVGSAISKVVTIVVLGSYAGLKFVRCVMFNPKPVYRIYLVLAAAAAAAYVAYMIAKFGSNYFIEWDLGPDSWHRFQRKGWAEFDRVIPTLLKDLGFLIILAGTFKLRDHALFVASAFGVSCYFIFPFLFTPVCAAMLILVAGYIVVTDGIPKTVISTILLGAILVLPHHLKRDVGSHYMTLVWLFTLGPAVFLALQSYRANADTQTHRHNNAHAVALFLGTLTLSLSLLAVASGDLRLGKKRHKVVSTTLYDIWLQTRQLTPPDALIFTDQTGNENDRLTGWNDYSLLAQRQFYLSTWASSSLRRDAVKRAEVLSSNEAILSGEIVPPSLLLTRNYGSYYAVVAADRSAPAVFRTVYGNKDYVLYEIESETEHDN